LSKERVRNLIAVCLSVSGGVVSLDNPGSGLVLVAVAQLSEFWAAMCIMSWPKLISSVTGLKWYPSAGMASATANVNSFAICQCLTNIALSFSVPITGSVINTPAQRSIANRMGISFLGSILCAWALTGEKRP